MEEYNPKPNDPFHWIRDDKVGSVEIDQTVKSEKSDEKAFKNSELRNSGFRIRYPFYPHSSPIYRPIQIMR